MNINNAKKPIAYSVFDKEMIKKSYPISNVDYSKSQYYLNRLFH